MSWGNTTRHSTVPLGATARVEMREPGTKTVPRRRRPKSACVNAESVQTVPRYHHPSHRHIHKGARSAKREQATVCNRLSSVICGSFYEVYLSGEKSRAKFFFSKASRRPHGRELNVPRALVDILRHQAGSSSCSERNNSLVINSNFQDNGSARPPKNLYSTVKPSKSSHDNMHHNYMHLNASSPKHHTATLDWHMNHTPSHSSGKYNTLSCSRSFHNLSHLPPSYETAIKSELNRYSSLKRLAAEKDLDEFYVKRRHLAELTRGTLPLHAMKMNYDRDGYSEKSHNPRRVMSQEHILSDGGGGGGGESYRPSHYDYTIPRDRVISHERLLSRENLHSQERLLSPERLHQGTGPFQDVHQGHQKALSQTNVCATSTPMLDHHHMMQMNSHPPANNSPKTTAPWEGSSSNQGGAASRRQGFAAKRQSTIEQLQYIPGHHPGQHIHTGSKNEVTV
uniref:Uncharacterized protein n=1 Tax=Sphaerodactylus townsendi TaxID=933632 RepID=A0ACB8EWJ2_9SAUR